MFMFVDNASAVFEDNQFGVPGLLFIHPSGWYMFGTLDSCG